MPPSVAAIIVSRITVKGFRAFDTVDVSLDRGTTFLVGANNCGKTSLLLALATAVGRRRASSDDLRIGIKGTAAQAYIDLYVSPADGDVFTDDIRQRLIAVQREPSNGREVVGIRTTLQRSGEGSLLLESRKFLLPLTTGEWVESQTPTFQARILDLIEVHLMDASRDLLNEMTAQTSPWGRVLSDLKIPDLPPLPEGGQDPLGRVGLEIDLASFSKRLRTASPVLGQLHSDLANLTQSQASVGTVDLIPLPIRIDELAKSIEVILSQPEAPGLPLRFHGLGSRSLASLLVFRSMCVLKVGADKGVVPHLITLLEEPEAHLHPQTVFSLSSTINSLPGQRIVSTHSRALVGEIPPTSIRLLRRIPGGGVAVSQVPAGTDKELEHFRRFLGRPFGEIFFARLVILCDGPSERNTLPVLLNMALGIDLVGAGVTFISCDSMGDCGRINKIVRYLHDLSVPWVCFADNDPAGKAALTKLEDPASGQPLSPEHSNVVMLKGTKQTEQLLIDAGYAQEIIDVAAEAGQAVVSEADMLKFLKSNKVWADEAVALRARANGKTPPKQLEDLVAAIKSRLNFQVATEVGTV